MSLAELVTNYTIENNTTHTAVAERIGICRSSFYNKVEGRSQFRLDEAATLAGLLGLSLDEFAVLAGGKE